MKNLLILSVFLAFALLYGRESYDFVMVSDMHFGQKSSFAAGKNIPSRLRARGDLDRETFVLPVLDAVMADIRAKSGFSTRFLIQCGDLIEGYNKSASAHRNELVRAMDFLKKRFPGPVYPVIGNHELSGIGSEPAARQVLLAEIAALGFPAKDKFVNYSVRCGNDLFIFVDYTTAPHWSKYVSDTVKQAGFQPRYLFLVIHAMRLPAVQEFPVMLKFFEDMGRYNTIVLTGHVHRNTVIEFTKDGSRMTLVSVSSRITRQNRNKLEMRLIESGKAALREKFTEGLKQRKRDWQIPFFEALCLPYITGYRRWGGAGYCRFHVSDRGVDLELQSADPGFPPVMVELLKR